MPMLSVSVQSEDPEEIKKYVDLLTKPDAPTEEPTPAKELVQGPLVIRDAPGTTLANKKVIGGIKLVNSSHCVLHNVEVTEARGDGLLLDNSPYTIVDGLFSYRNGFINSKGNRVGHGVRVAGDGNGIFIENSIMCFNIEDGVQHSNDATGLVTYSKITIFGNCENAMDFKSASANIYGSILVQLAQDQVILMHNYAGAVTVTASKLYGHNTAPIGSVMESAALGSLIVGGCGVYKPNDTRWWTDASTAFDFDQTVSGRVHVVVVDRIDSMDLENNMRLVRVAEDPTKYSQL